MGTFPCRRKDRLSPYPEIATESGRQFFRPGPVPTGGARQDASECRVARSQSFLRTIAAAPGARQIYSPESRHPGYSPIVRRLRAHPAMFLVAPRIVALDAPQLHYGCRRQASRLERLAAAARLISQIVPRSSL